MSRVRVCSLLGLCALVTGCALILTPDLSQGFDLTFKLETTLAEGEVTQVSVSALPDAIKLRRRWVQVSGQLSPPAGGRLPRRVKLVLESSDMATGDVLRRFRMTLKIRPEDTFRVSKRLFKNLRAGSLLTVTAEPEGAGIPKNTEVRLCLQIVEKKSDLSTVASCAPQGEPTTFAAIQNRILSPSCAKSGCHDAATASEGLVLEAGQAYGELVNALSTQKFLVSRVAPGRPDDSYLVKKIRGSSDISGVRMPQDGPPFLSSGQIAGIVEWIENGARND